MKAGEIVVSAKMYSAFNGANNKITVRLSRPLRFRLKLSLWVMQIAAWLAYAEYEEDGEWKSTEKKSHIGTIAYVDIARGVAFDTDGNEIMRSPDNITWTMHGHTARHPL